MRIPVDIATVPGESGEPDWALDESGDLVMEFGLSTFIMHALFSDARDEAPEMPLSRDPRGWAVEDRGERYGSLLWTLARSKMTPEVMARSIAYCKRALEPLISLDIAEGVDVEGRWARDRIMILDIILTRGRAKAWSWAWESPVSTSLDPGIEGLVVYLTQRL